MTDELDEAQADDATVESDVPAAIARLGIEAQTEFIRARQRLGLSDDPVGSLGVVGRYRLEAEIGRGGMGIVYRAHDPQLDRPVAIKLVQAAPFVRHDKLRTRLLREAKVLAKLTHSNVVRVYDCGQHNGEVYLAMEYVEGTTLRDWQQGQPRRSIVDAYMQAARGLVAAHDMGITHRDFKPDNVLVAADGRVLVGDFGLAALTELDEGRVTDAPADDIAGGRGTATRTGAMLGTPTYMAPEQLRGEAATPRSDQFAFCVSLWEALTGQRPFEGERPEALLERIEQGRTRGSDLLPRRLRARLLRGLSEDPEARGVDLRGLVDTLQPRRARMVLGAVLVLSLATGLVAGRWLREPAPAPAECALETSLAEVRGMPQWDFVSEQLAFGTTYARLQSKLESMSKEAELLCRPGADDRAMGRRQHFGMWVADLEDIIGGAPNISREQLLAALAQVENDSWSRPPPRPLAQGVADLLVQSRSAERHNDIDSALTCADRAIVAADGKYLELARAHQRRGRVLARLGRHEEAMDAYREAIPNADAAAYDDARLDTLLLMAKTAVMRQGDLGGARGALGRARGLLLRLDEPWFSPRQADYHEVLASVLKRDEAFDAAFDHQAWALLIRSWWDDVAKISMGYLNLGTIHELRDRGSDPGLARVSYDRALALLDPEARSPEWYEAASALGHWLVQNSAVEWSQAKDLLEAASRGSKDMRPYALTDLVLLAILREEFAEARSRAQELSSTLLAGTSLSPDKRLDAWQTVAIAYAQAGDLEAFEDARVQFEGQARARREHGSPAQVVDLELQTARLDLTAAFVLGEAAPARARELAASARETLSRLPQARRPEGMLDAAIELAR